MIPIFFPFGILVGELLWMWIKKLGIHVRILLSTECIIIGTFSLIRIVTSIPVSGHTIILSFYLLHQIFSNRLHYPIRVLSGFLVFFITIFHKIFLWNDPITFFLGLLFGFVIWIPGYVYRSKYIEKSSTTITKHVKRFKQE